MFNKQSTLSISLKIIIPLWLIFLLFAFSIFFVFIPSLKMNMMAQKKEMIQKLTDSTISLLSEYVQRVESKELTVEDALSRAINRIRNLRYGQEGEDYFWINDMEPKMIMHPCFLYETLHNYLKSWSFIFCYGRCSNHAPAMPVI